MRKMIIKTVFITLGVMLVVALSVFGIVSFCAPASMMKLCASIGLKKMSGDYAYQQYQNTNDIHYLARSFEIAIETRNDPTAEKRWEELYGTAESERRTEFDLYCEIQTVSSLPEDMQDCDYRSSICGLAARVKYRLALSDEAKEEVCDFAIEESEDDLSAESPVVMLAAEAVQANDKAFCKLLYDKISKNYKFLQNNEHYINMMQFLEETFDE